ncbi:MAG: lipopolysaccharide kinase InaA family protein, partial [Gemmatimonadaceae bacterium]
LLLRVDVMTAEVPNASDLGAFLAHTVETTERQEAWRAVARLLRRLAQTGVWHPDLNAKNVLIMLPPPPPPPPPPAVIPIGGEEIAATQELPTAVVLDIDRVKLVVPGDPQLAEANLERLLRSLRKWARDARNGPPVNDAELTAFAELVRENAAAAAPAPAS